MMNLRNAVANLAIGHGLADILQRNRSHYLPVCRDKPREALVLLETREIYAVSLKLSGDLLIRHRSQRIKADRKRLAPPFDEFLEVRGLVRKQAELHGHH